LIDMPAKISWQTQLLDWIKKLPWFRAGPRDSQPYSIGNRRIYVLPTRFGLFVGLVLAVLNLGALNYNNNAAILLGFIIISICNNSLISAHLSLLAIRMQTQPVAPVFAGQTLQLATCITPSAKRSAGGNIYGLQFDDSSMSISIGAQECIAVLPITTNKRGLFVIERIQLFTHQPLGLAKAWCYLNLHETVLIYPTPRGQPLNSHFNSASGKAGRDRRLKTDQPHHLREFRTGDSRKQIAWKISARTETLQVREYENASTDDLLLDWQSLSYIGYEQRIEQLCLWVIQAEQKHLCYALHIPGKQMPSGSGAEHKRHCLEQLALLPYEQ
jgi:uncharacterized protein (DUF58 family)